MKVGKRVILILLFYISSFLYGEVYLDVPNTTPRTGETFSMNVIMEKKEKYNIENIENFRVLSRYTSTNTSIINGKRSSQYSENFELLTLKEGTFPLKAITKNGESNTVNIEVSKDNTPNTSQNYIIKTTPEKDTYYFGEKIPYVESLVTNISVQGIDYIERPNFGDLSITDMNSGRIGSIQNKTTLNGRSALDIVLFQGLLEPSSSGTKEIGSSIVRLTLGGRDPFSRNVQNLASETKKITILPLPDGAPSNFKGIVGDITGEVTMDRTSVKKGEAATLTLVLSGSGDLLALKDLIPNNSGDFNIYENVVNSDRWIEDKKFFNKKTFQIAFIPKKDGKLKTPKIEIPYFDTTNKEYKSFVIEGIDIDVSESDNPIINENNNNISEIQSPVEEVTISTIPSVVETKKSKNWIVILLITLIIIQGGAILYLLRDKILISKRSDDPLKPLKSSKDDNKFYYNYCVFMKNKYGFNPKAHSSDRLKNEEIRKIHLEIEKARFHKEALNKKDIIKKLEKL